MNNSSTGADAPLYMQGFSAFKGKTLEQSVRELADREEIRELIARYAHRVAHGASAADLFTDDGAFINRRPGQPAHEVRGRKDLDEFYGNMHVRACPMPILHNYLLVISGDEALGLCSNEVRMVEDEKSVIGSGYYEDTFRRVNGVWKFVVRDAIFFHWVPIQQGWADPAKSS